MNYLRFISQISKNRKPLIIRELANLQNNASPETIFFSGGYPHSKSFPIVSGSFQLNNGKTLEFDKKLMTSALQYGGTQGYPPLIEEFTKLLNRFHSPPLMNELKTVVTTGSQDGISKAFDMLLNLNDTVIVEEPCYAGALAALYPYSPNFLIVESDKYGMIPQSLEKVVADNQNVNRGKLNHPKLMYINPTASNPTGVTVPTERRKEIYDIAQFHDILILEDDPYYFLEFREYNEMPPSFLSLDTAGLVMRFDSFSKIFSGGLRIGFATGNSYLIDKIILHKQASDLQASSLSQYIVYETLNHWKKDGFDRNIKQIKDFYKSQRDVMQTALERNVSDICSWHVPTGGMFFWIKVLDLEDTWDMVMERGLKKNVVMIPGRAFSADSDAKSPYLRLSFSQTSSKQIERGIQNLAELVREELVLCKNVV